MALLASLTTALPMPMPAVLVVDGIVHRIVQHHVVHIVRIVVLIIIVLVVIVLRIIVVVIVLIIIVHVVRVVRIRRRTAIDGRISDDRRMLLNAGAHRHCAHGLLLLLDLAQAHAFDQMVENVVDVVLVLRLALMVVEVQRGVDERTVQAANENILTI